MAEPTYVLDSWGELDHYTCLAPWNGGLHGTDAWSLAAITAHLLETHGLEAILDPGE